MYNGDVTDMIQPVTKIEQTYQTGAAAEMVGVHQQTIIKWANSGVLHPSKKRRTKDSPRKYTVQDLVALMVAKAAYDFRFPRKALKEMAQMAQRADKSELKRAAVIAYRSETPGMIRMAWYPNVNNPAHKKEIAELRRMGRLVDEASMEKLTEEMYRQIDKKLTERALAGTDQKTN